MCVCCGEVWCVRVTIYLIVLLLFGVMQHNGLSLKNKYVYVSFVCLVHKFLQKYFE